MQINSKIPRTIQDNPGLRESIIQAGTAPAPQTARSPRYVPFVTPTDTHTERQQVIPGAHGYTSGRG